MPEVITNNLDLWTSALLTKSTTGRGSNGKQEAYGIKKLRELILELAMHGKLVPQDPNDEPAIEALRRTTRAVRPITINAQESIPVGWISLPLACVIASNIGGGTPSKQNPLYWNGAISWASVKDIQTDKYLTATLDSITEEGLKNSSSNLIPPGRLLIVTRMGLGKLAINNIPVAINQDLRAIEPNEALNLDFAYLLFKALKLVGKGVTVKGVTVEEVHAMSIALPPLAEQHRIVGKVDELMDLCDQLEQQQTNSLEAHKTLVETLLGTLTHVASQQELTEAWARITDHFDTLFTTEHSIDLLKQTILQLAVMGKVVPQDPNDEPASVLLEKIAREKEQLIIEGKLRSVSPLPRVAIDEQPFGIPESWEWVRLGTALRKITDGTHHSPPNGEVGDFLYISAKNIKDDGVMLSNATYVSKEVHEEIYSRCDPELGDVLYVKDGATTGIATVNNLQQPFSMLSSVALLKCPQGLLNTYLLLSLRSPYLYSEMRAGMTGVAITRVTLKKLNEVYISLPPLAEQHRIVAKVDELMALCDSLKARIKDAQIIQIHFANAIVEQAVA